MPYLSNPTRQLVKQRYWRHPLTLETVNDALSSLKQRTMSRGFVKQWLKTAEHKTDYYCLVCGTVGSGNKTQCQLTVGGFFDILFRRARTRQMERFFFNMHKHVQQLTALLDRVHTLEHDMTEFVKHTKHKQARSVLSYMF
jgi:hypothetical protein